MFTGCFPSQFPSFPLTEILTRGVKCSPCVNHCRQGSLKKVFYVFSSITIVNCWLYRLIYSIFQTMVSVLQDMSEKYLDKVLTFKYENCKELVPIPEINGLRSLSNLFDALATPENGVSIHLLYQELFYFFAGWNMLTHPFVVNYHKIFEAWYYLVNIFFICKLAYMIFCIAVNSRDFSVI